MKKILIIGGVAGGASTAARLRRHSEEDRIIMFEKGPHVSFSNCGLPYHLSGMISEVEKLVLMSPQKFLAQYNIEARVNSEVIEIDRENKEIVVKDVVTKKLGEGVNKTHNLNPEAIKRTLDCLKKYKEKASSYGVENIRAFATSAVRDAENREVFLQEVSKLGIKIEYK